MLITPAVTTGIFVRGFYASMDSVLESSTVLDRDLESLMVVVVLLVLRRMLCRCRQRLVEFRRVRRQRKCWVKPWLLRRHNLGAYDGLMMELANEDIPGYVAFQRLAPHLFGELLSKIGPLIQRQDTIMRTSISPGARLAITLRYLATGIKLFC